MNFIIFTFSLINELVVYQQIFGYLANIEVSFHESVTLSRIPTYRIFYQNKFEPTVWKHTETKLQTQKITFSEKRNIDS